jgi:hypothetical protein
MRSNARYTSASVAILLYCFDLRETKIVSPECLSCHSLANCTRSVHVRATLLLISAHKYTVLDNRQYLWGVEGGGADGGQETEISCEFDRICASAWQQPAVAPFVLR